MTIYPSNGAKIKVQYNDASNLEEVEEKEKKEEEKEVLVMVRWWDILMVLVKFATGYRRTDKPTNRQTDGPTL